jgi:hypothetical protein
MLNALKYAALAIAALVTTIIAGMQFLALQKHIPDGPRILVILEYVGGAFLIFALIGALFVIPKKNRNVLSFLKAFAVAGVLACLGNCSSWMGKFQGPKQRIASESGLSLEVPSDWGTPAEKAPNADLVLTDWASTSVVTAVRVPSDDPAPDDAAFEQMLAAVEEQGKSRLGTRLSDFPCGKRCRGAQYEMTANGKKTRVVMIIRHSGSDWLVLSGATFATPIEKRMPVVIDILRSAHIPPAGVQSQSPAQQGEPAAAN